MVYIHSEWLLDVSLHEVHPRHGIDASEAQFMFGADKEHLPAYSLRRPPKPHPAPHVGLARGVGAPPRGVGRVDALLSHNHTCIVKRDDTCVRAPANQNELYDNDETLPQHYIY